MIELLLVAVMGWATCGWWSVMMHEQQQPLSTTNFRRKWSWRHATRVTAIPL